MRAPHRKVNIGALIELVLWTALPYITIGLVWSFFHPGQVLRIQGHLPDQPPIGSLVELVAFGISAMIWPVLLLAPDN